MHDKINNNAPKKRGRGRPKKKPLEKPKFDTDAEFRQYLLDVGLDIVLEMKDQALKRGNIKKPEIARAKTQQYKVVLDAIKTIDGLLKSKQLDILEEKFNNFELGFNPGASDDAVIEFGKMQDNLKEIKDSI